MKEFGLHFVKLNSTAMSERNRWSKRRTDGYQKNYSCCFQYLCINCHKSIYFHLLKQKNHRLLSQSTTGPRITVCWQLLFVVLSKGPKWATSENRFLWVRMSPPVQSFNSARKIWTSLISWGWISWLLVTVLDSFNVFLVAKRWATEVMQWVPRDCSATRLQAASEAAERTEPRIKAKSAGGHFLFEKIKTLLLYISIPAAFICCMAQLLCHIFDLDLIWSSLWLNRKFSWESSNFSLPSPHQLLLACHWYCWIFIWTPVH